MTQRCPKGHWYEPEAGGTVGCPQCATQTQNETSVSDDDVLAIMSEADVAPEVRHSTEEAAKPSTGSGIMRRKKKVCPDCSHEASFSFVYCPRCGAPLKPVSVELP
jgi:hypothetical protein